MPGLPGDTFEKDIESVKKSISMKPDICRLYPSLVLKDTPMEIMYNRGDYIPYTVEEAVDICKELYKMYNSNNINVIRIGLQPTDEIAEGKDVVAGPFHPAFRELVEGSLMADRIREEVKEPSSIIVTINNKDISKLYANRKTYFNKLLQEGYKIKVVQNSTIERGDLIIEKL